MVAEIRHVRNVSQQHVNKTVSGPKDIVYVTISFGRARCAVGDAQVEVTLSVVDHAV